MSYLLPDGFSWLKTIIHWRETVCYSAGLSSIFYLSEYQANPFNPGGGTVDNRATGRC